MKTTTPERYKVRPSSGHLRSGDTCVMDVMVSKSHAANTANIGIYIYTGCSFIFMISNSVQDKFMLSALTIDSDNLSQQNIYTSLKHSKPEAQYRIRCILQSDQVRKENMQPKLSKEISYLHFKFLWGEFRKKKQMI